MAPISPFRGCVENIEGLKACGFSPDDPLAMARDSALGIMPQWQRRQRKHDVGTLNRSG